MTTTNKLKIIAVDIRKDVVVVDQNSEFSDLSNPQGYIYGTNHEVLAITESGRRFRHRHFFGEEWGQANDFANKVRKRGEIDPDYWVETYPVYGSLAWEDNEWDRRGRLHDALSRGDSEEIDRWS